MTDFEALFDDNYKKSIQLCDLIKKSVLIIAHKKDII